MRSKVAEDVRDELQQEELALTPSERLQRAFDLGEEDLHHFAAANGLTREEALSRLRAESQAGQRHFSKCKAG